MTAKTLLLAAAVALSPVPAISQEQTDPARLAAILRKSADYCRRLDRAALDFVCLEEVTEMSRHYTPRTDVYLYDYQFLRKNQDLRERRDLIAVNGKRTNIRDSSLKSVMFQYQNVLFGPVGLLGESRQGHYEYKIIGEAALDGERAVVIEATPGPRPGEPRPFGRIWVKEDDGSVLKIVWDQRSLGNYTAIEAWAKSHDSEPRITAFSEYGLEKNGLRFPIRSYTEQAYLREDMQKFVSAEISVLYKDYKFFTVETEIKY